ncbi:MAG: hypothetical protein A2V77_02775 [Anaeromyxobacter sp. RBG_16_69_14]|nr:MAG: hypothetical protein A2V77_02775 [Anaeromyxobacter sp. RBG_16_69_14]
MVNFTWDPKKAESNLRKHRVSFEEAMTVFEDPLALMKPDVLDPDRIVALGMSEKERVLYCVYFEVDEKETRIISARRATSHERRNYEEGA